MDDRSRIVETRHTQNRGYSLLATAPERVRRVGAMGHLRSRLAGRTRAGALSGAADRRRHQLELGPLCGTRRNALQHGRAVGIHRQERAHGGRLHGSPFDVHGTAATGREPGATTRSRPADAVGTGTTAVGYRLDSGAFATG